MDENYKNKKVYGFGLRNDSFNFILYNNLQWVLFESLT